MGRGVAVILAGGNGRRLHPLTLRSAKPALRFAGAFRLIDFTLSNCVNSALRQIFVITQYQPAELVRHLRRSWSFFARPLGEFLEVLFPMRGPQGHWFLGTADALLQNLDLIGEARPEVLLVLSADHIYQMDYRALLRDHEQSGAELTLATTLVDPEDAHRFGIIDTDSSGWVTGFREKPRGLGTSPQLPSRNKLRASMGIYAFNLPALRQALLADASDPRSTHDFGADILPRYVRNGSACAHDYRGINPERPCYWRDVGTIPSYFQAHMDLFLEPPRIDLNDPGWPVYTGQNPVSPVRVVGRGPRVEATRIVDSIISAGTVIRGANLVRTILCDNVRVGAGCDIEESIILPNAVIGEACRLRRSIVTEGVRLPPGTELGLDPEADRKRGYHVTSPGIVVAAGGNDEPPVAPDGDAGRVSVLTRCTWGPGKPAGGGGVWVKSLTRHAAQADVEFQTH